MMCALKNTFMAQQKNKSKDRHISSDFNCLGAETTTLLSAPYANLKNVK
jgi:hypothetical protein